LFATTPQRQRLRSLALHEAACLPARPFVLAPSQTPRVAPAFTSSPVAAARLGPGEKTGSEEGLIVGVAFSNFESQIGLAIAISLSLSLSLSLSRARLTAGAAESGTSACLPACLSAWHG